MSRESILPTPQWRQKTLATILGTTKRKAKREREKLRKNKKKGKGDSANNDFENLQDTVKFGERVDAPPTIALKKFPKVSSKAGSKSLLLNKTLNGGAGVVKKKKSMAQKVALERDRLKIVQQYRQLKAQKWSIFFIFQNDSLCLSLGFDQQ